MRRLRPRMIDPSAFLMVAVAFGLGVLFVAQHSKTLRLDVEATNLAWVVLVGFGMTWHGEWRHGWRVGAGLVLGCLASIGAFYAVMARFPITPFSVGLGLGVAAACVAVITHMYPRAMSFAGAAVGFGVGIAVSRAMPIRPTTPADDMFALMLTAAMTLVIGVVGSLALRAIVVRMGMGGHPKLVDRLMPHRAHADIEETAEIGPLVTTHTHERMRAGR